MCERGGAWFVNDMTLLSTRQHALGAVGRAACDRIDLGVMLSPQWEETTGSNLANLSELTTTLRMALDRKSVV